VGLRRKQTLQQAHKLKNLRNKNLKTIMYTQLFTTFAKIGSFTLGGGYAMVPVMQKEIVEKKGWLASDEFMDILAVSQATPGLFAMNMASHIGYKLKGTLGGIVGALAVALPSIIAILLIAMFFQAFKDNIYVEKIFMGIRPAVVALIAAPCFSMARTAKINRYNIWIPVVAALLICAFGVSPIWVILAAGIGGFIYGRIK
jgi:chromate transporter